MGAVTHAKLKACSRSCWSSPTRLKAALGPSVRALTVHWRDAEASAAARGAYVVRDRAALVDVPLLVLHRIVQLLHLAVLMGVCEGGSSRWRRGSHMHGPRGAGAKQRATRRRVLTSLPLMGHFVLSRSSSICRSSSSSSSSIPAAFLYSFMAGAVMGLKLRAGGACREGGGARAAARERSARASAAAAGQWSPTDAACAH